MLNKDRVTQVKQWHPGQLALLWVAGIALMSLLGVIFSSAESSRVAYDASRSYPNGPLYLEYVWWALPLRIICGAGIASSSVLLLVLTWIWFGARREPNA